MKRIAIILSLILGTSLVVQAQYVVRIIGPTQVDLGETATYTTAWTKDGKPVRAPSWGDYNWIVAGGSHVTNSPSSCVILWQTAGPGVLALSYYSTEGPFYATINVQINGTNPPAVPNSVFNYTYNCNSSIITGTGFPPPGSGYDWWWQTSATGESTDLGNASSIIRTTSGELYLRARLVDSPYLWSEAAQYVGNIKVVTPPGLPADATDFHAISNTAVPATVSVSAVPDATSYRWYWEADPLTPIPGVTGSAHTFNLAQSQATFLVEALNESCPSENRKSVQANKYPEPVISANNNGLVSHGNPVTLSINNYSYDSYVWLDDNDNPIPGVNGSTHVTPLPGTYKVKVTKGTAPPVISSPYVVRSAMATVNMNYIITNSITQPGVTTNSQVAVLPFEANNQTIQYFDGIGRPVQTIVTQGSPGRKDIVTPEVYDEFGRSYRKYLSVAVGKDGIYKSNENLISPVDGNYAGIAASFYAAGSDNSIADDDRPFSETILEASPLNRPLKDFGPGKDWVVSNKSISYEYLTNIDGLSSGMEKIMLWKVDDLGNLTRNMSESINGGTGYYPSNALYVKQTLDEEGNPVREYTTKLGKLVLKKVYVAGAKTDFSTIGNWAETYYVYDDYGNLCFVLQPELMKEVLTESLQVPTLVMLNKFAFQYKYDARHRMVEKRVPGADWIYMVYDNRDRLVLSQDANQRALPTKYWTFTKYDALNRPILTGIKDTTDVCRAAMQKEVDRFYKKTWTRYSEEYVGNIAGNMHGYSNKSYPVVTSGASADASAYLTATYYDQYDFLSLWPGDYGYFNDALNHVFKSVNYDQPVTTSVRAQGYITGTRTKVLDGGITGGSTWLNNITYYDDRYRVIQTVSDNYRGGKDRTSTLYDFAGQVLKTRIMHETGRASEQTVERSFDYDHAGRLLRIWHSIDGQDPVLLVMNEYNELGQLVDKKLYNTDPETTADASRVFKQSVDYRYNIRGWLKSVNDTDASETGDLFGMNLHYNTPSANGGTAQYNGNISEIVWKGPDAQTNSYGYYYDPMNRLLEAKYYNVTAPVKNGRFDEKISAYDLNGNIKSLQRNGMTGADGSGIVTYGPMDNLTYDYLGNQLLKVSDSRTEIGGFIDGANTDDDYGYDENGNMTKDKNKDITGEDIATGTSSITYNFLNLPEKVVKHNGEYIKYIYDATGKKLSQEVYSATDQLVKKSDYAGEFFYENDTLKFINHEEGRVVVNGSSPEYQYHLKDHLGNVRVTFTTKEEAESATSTLETENTETEQTRFLRYESARRVYSPLVDRTNNSSPSGTDGYAQRLSGGSYEKYGLAKSLSVMPGDKINAEVYAKYIDPVEDNRTPPLNELISQIVNGTAPAGTVIDGGGYTTSTTSFPFASLAAENTGGSTETGPKAYLNWLVFDRDYNLIDAGYDRLSSEPRETGQNIGHEKLFSPEITIQEAGFVYIFLSNEESATLEVYFDDFKVEHIESPVVQMDDYYPFGLTFNSYSRENSVDQEYKFQGQEHIDDLNLGWDSFKWRNHQPDIGRFFNVDPIAEKYYYNSPYAFSENKVVAHIELEGLESVGIEAIDLVAAMTPKPPEPAGRDKVLNGLGNVFFGTVGALGSGAYILGTDGAGAALGGGTAFGLSIGEITIGFAQIVDGVHEMRTGEESPSSTILQSVSTLPGLVAAGTGSEDADLIDAAGALLPGALSGGNAKQILQAPKEILSSKTLGQAAFNVSNATDAVLDVTEAVNANKNEVTKQSNRPSSGTNITWQKISDKEASNLTNYVKTLK